MLKRTIIPISAFCIGLHPLFGPRGHDRNRVAVGAVSCAGARPKRTLRQSRDADHGVGADPWGDLDAPRGTGHRGAGIRVWDGMAARPGRADGARKAL